MRTNDREHLTQRLLDWYETQSWAAELEALTPLVLSELARAEPVDVARIAARAGMTASHVLTALAFLAVLDIKALVESPCFATGEPIRIQVGPEGVRSVEPTEAVVSIVTPAANLSDFARPLRHEQHFFSSRRAASQWQAAHPEGIVVSVASEAA